MKILKIFGLVVGIHAAVFLFVFAIPGCRSPAVKTPGAGTAPATSVAPAPVPFNPDAPASPRPQRSDAPVVAASLPPPAPVVAPAPPPPAPAETYMVKGGDNLWNLARNRGLTAAEIAAANNLSVNSVLHVGQKLQLPSKTATATAPAASPTSDSAGTTGYVVKSGDTLGGIARRHGTTSEALRTLNSLRGDTIRVGDRLRVPLTPGGAVAPAPAPSPTASASGSVTGSVTHTVKAGENLDAIALLYGVRRRDIEVANSLANSNSLRAGQVLSIPGFQVKTPAVTSPVSPAPPPPTRPRSPPPAPAPVSPAPPPPAATLPTLPPVNFGPASTPAPAPAAPRTGPQITIEPDNAPRIRQDGAR